MSLVWLAGGWALFGAMHSALISQKVVGYVSFRLGQRAGYYRVAFNIVSCIALIPLVLFESHLSAKMPPWFPDWWPLRLALLATGLLFFMAGSRKYDIGEFLGFAQIRSGHLTKTLSSENRFVSDGVLSWVRHPWYTGSFCVLYARPWNDASVTSDIVLSLYLVVGTLIEERRLVREFGAAYRRYQKQVPMFIPWKIWGAWSAKGPKKG